MKKNEDTNNIFVAINGDDVGASIGQAVASDDREGLDAKSSAVSQAHSSVSEWVESMGGEVITSSGDEAIYSIPAEAAANLEQIRQKYVEISGHTVTIGIGNSMSEASKALIYGKLNDKDQIVEYSPELEDAIGVEDDAMPADEMPADEMPADEMGSDEEMMSDMDLQDPEETEPEHEQDMNPEEELLHDAMENEEDELDTDSVEADEEMEDEGLDGIVDEDSELIDEDMAHASQSITEEGEIPEDYDENAALADMIYGEMDGQENEEMPQEEMPPEEMQEDDSANDELRGNVAQVLSVFKENKDALESARDSNPQLYEAMIAMLQSMIEMGKKLGFTPEEDVMAQEEAMGMEDNFPGPEDEEIPKEEMPPEMMVQDPMAQGKLPEKK